MPKLEPVGDAEKPKNSLSERGSYPASLDGTGDLRSDGQLGGKVQRLTHSHTGHERNPAGNVAALLLEQPHGQRDVVEKDLAPGGTHGPTRHNLKERLLSASWKNRNSRVHKVTKRCSFLAN